MSEKSLCARTDCNFVSFTYINVSLGSVATQFRCGEIINNRFIANVTKSVTVKKILKSVKIWRRYGKKYGGMFFFDSRCKVTQISAALLVLVAQEPFQCFLHCTGVLQSFYSAPRLTELNAVHV